MDSYTIGPFRGHQSAGGVASNFRLSEKQACTKLIFRNGGSLRHFLASLIEKTAGRHCSIDWSAGAARIRSPVCDDAAICSVGGGCSAGPVPGRLSAGTVLSESSLGSSVRTVAATSRSESCRQQFAVSELSRQFMVRELSHQFTVDELSLPVHGQ